MKTGPTGGRRRDDDGGGAARPDAALLAQLATVSFTPGRRHFSSLLPLLEADDKALARSVEQALLRAGLPAANAAIALFSSETPILRAALCGLVGRIAASADESDSTAEREGLLQFLLDVLRDPDPRTRRAAVRALAKLRLPHASAIEDALLEAWEREHLPEQRRPLVDALGKIGGDRAHRLVEALAPDLLDADPQLRRLAGEALLRLSRRRSAPPATAASAAGDAADDDAPRGSTLLLEALPPRPLPVLVRCRAGLEPMVERQLAASPLLIASPARVVAPGQLRFELATSLRSMLALRSMLNFGFPLPEQPLVDGDVATALVRALTSAHAALVLSTFSTTPLRYRLELSGPGRRRALVLRCAQAVSAARPAWINDPSDRQWEVIVEERGLHAGAGADALRRSPHTLAVELRPRVPDERFAWRVADVPAASHPTVAAALAETAVRHGSASRDDIIWDPFVGSGAELIERARLAPYRSLLGSDIDADALDAARRNLEAAGIPLVPGAGGAALIQADARALRPGPVSLILTNPPLGRRIARDGHLAELLDSFLANAAAALVSGGLLVWISPFPERTAARAAVIGLRVVERAAIDLGGFEGELQVFRRD